MFSPLLVLSPTSRHASELWIDTVLNVVRDNTNNGEAFRSAKSGTKRNRSGTVSTKNNVLQFVNYTLFRDGNLVAVLL
jgi:hypothetical protein